MLLEYNKVNNESKFSPCPIFQCHIVYYNADKYDSFADASKSADGLGIVAVLCNVSTCIFSLLIGKTCVSWINKQNDTLRSFASKHFGADILEMAKTKGC